MILKIVGIELAQITALILPFDDYKQGEQVKGEHPQYIYVNINIAWHSTKHFHVAFLQP